MWSPCTLTLRTPSCCWRLPVTSAIRTDLSSSTWTPPPAAPSHRPAWRASAKAPSHSGYILHIFCPFNFFLLVNGVRIADPPSTPSRRYFCFILPQCMVHCKDLLFSLQLEWRESNENDMIYSVSVTTLLHIGNLNSNFHNFFLKESLFCYFTYMD